VLKRARLSNTLKPKDLVGIPWRVAFALQQPFYTGRIRKEADRIWLAAMIDGEGCMFIHKRKAGQSNGQGYERKHDSFGAGLEVANTHLSIIERCMEIVGQGSICHQDKETAHKFRNLRLYRWSMRSNECREIVREVYPYLTAKKHEARLLLGCPPSGELAERAHAGLIGLHNGKEADIDFPEPASMYEPGWYLRSDIIWSKNNPMPESVRDRPTKAHEYLFLLAKQPAYFYDAEATKEPAIMQPQRRNTDGKGPKSVGYVPHRQATGDTDPNMQRGGRNRRDVWTIPTAPYKGAHFAAFPPKLVEPCILAGTSAKGVCPECGAPWERVQDIHKGGRSDTANPKTSALGRAHAHGHSSHQPGWRALEPDTTRFLGWRPTCDHDAEPVPAVVLDPFCGSGTVGAVCRKLGRKFIGLDLSAPYLELARERLAKTTTGMAI